MIKKSEESKKRQPEETCTISGQHYWESMDFTGRLLSMPSPKACSFARICWNQLNFRRRQLFILISLRSACSSTLYDKNTGACVCERNEEDGERKEGQHFQYSVRKIGVCSASAYRTAHQTTVHRCPCHAYTTFLAWCIPRLLLHIKLG